MTAPALIALTGLAALILFIVRIESKPHRVTLKRWLRDLDTPILRNTRPTAYRPGKYLTIYKA